MGAGMLAAAGAGIMATTAMTMTIDELGLYDDQASSAESLGLEAPRSSSQA
jgi:hypothetical protein